MVRRCPDPGSFVISRGPSLSKCCRDGCGVVLILYIKGRLCVSFEEYLGNVCAKKRPMAGYNTEIGGIVVVNGQVLSCDMPGSLDQAFILYKLSFVMEHVGREGTGWTAGSASGVDQDIRQSSPLPKAPVMFTQRSGFPPSRHRHRPI